MAPTLVMDRDQRRSRKRMSGFHSVLAAHRHAEAPDGLCSAGVQHDDPWRETTRDIRRALEPKSIAGDIDQITRLVSPEGKSNHVTSVDSDRAMAGRGCGHEELLAV